MKLEKITKSRHYDDACATAHGLDLLGERWALLVVRELMLGPRRFGDLRASLPGLSANVLTQRLEGLESAGVLRRRKLPPPASVQVYELTEWGLEAEPIVLSFGRWATRSPAHDPTLPLSAVALMLSFRAKWGDVAGRVPDVSLGYHHGDEVYTVAVKGGRLITERGAPEAPDAELAGDPAAVAGYIYAKVPLDQLPLTVTGDHEALARFAAPWEMAAKAPG
ncbi:winged helix-turn-helix transcriptional regulator [Caulobacter mirabilis]|uniref:Transcriptional regulator n=1 Tax=Caulobacter mirabilis TaxID=69666 RepID=A0A2D2AUA6_9CAUL|nr:helix-turn-helix domain-containing protein [Caulobacter mirabilis]ATQ41586.1 transcriptional regulator [Caulobacter mirabilis]